MSGIAVNRRGHAIGADKPAMVYFSSINAM